MHTDIFKIFLKIDHFSIGTSFYYLHAIHRMLSQIFAIFTYFRKNNHLIIYLKLLQKLYKIIVSDYNFVLK